VEPEEPGGMPYRSQSGPDTIGTDFDMYFNETELQVGQENEARDIGTRCGNIVPGH
jgi:hypothetical protein